MAKHYDYIAIGGGSGGIASINRAAMYGVKGLLIEGNELGGTCVNVGCVPKKVMWHASQISESLKLYANDYGFNFIFAKGVEAFGKEGDFFFGISTSGNSRNVIEAVKIAEFTNISEKTINKITKNIRILMSKEFWNISNFSEDIGNR